MHGLVRGRKLLYMRQNLQAQNRDSGLCVRYVLALLLLNARTKSVAIYFHDASSCPWNSIDYTEILANELRYYWLYLLVHIHVHVPVSQLYSIIQLSVEGFPYTGMGNSTNKKDAQANAARDFCQYLVRQGQMKPEEIPAMGQTQVCCNIYMMYIFIICSHSH